MRRLAFVIVFGAFLLSAASAQAKVGLSAFDVAFLGPNGEAVSQAASHPYAMAVSLSANTVEEGGTLFADEGVKDVEVTNVDGLAGDPTAVPPCQTADFLVLHKGTNLVPECPDNSAVGVADIGLGAPGGVIAHFHVPLYDLAPPPGSVAKLGFYVSEVPVTISLGVSPDPPHRIVAHSTNLSQVVEFISAKLTLWGVPADPRHDNQRGLCAASLALSCPAGLAPVPFLTLPGTCAAPLASDYAVDSWQHPAAHLPDGEPDLSDPAWSSGSALTHGESIPPEPQAMSGCGSLGFGPTITAQPTTKAASSPTGLDFSLDVADEGLMNTKEGATAASDIRKAVVTLPEGFSVNPSVAEGLAVCSEADLARESATSEAGEGCPSASKLGSVEVETPLLEGKLLKGALYQAAPYENPFGSLIALYVVIQNRELGISIVQPLRVESDPVTGRLSTVAEEMPQLPFSHFRLHFREGTRSPLASPPACGTYNAEATLYPWSGGKPVTTNSAFQIISGPDAGPCPSGTSQPFHPGLEAGTINNAAGKYSPFYTRLSRNDSEQEITHFSIKLPPGVIGKLAGIPYCSDAAIAQAQGRTGPHGGSEELESPSCPAASEVGHTLAGAGVGPSLAYAPGKLYLAGPYHGSALSLVAITAAKVGPFDLGTVVVRFALKINPETAEVFVDATGSDPLPHIIKGIPVHLRDIRAYVDRPDFVLNPTSCARTSTASTVLGSGTNFGSEADDQPITVTSPFQAADCASLGFAPKLALSLKGGTKRGDTPAFKALLTYPKGYYANIASAQVTLPHSVFLEQAHIKTICTRTQFAAGGGNGEQCPAASIYGKAKAVTPLLSTPLEGPVFLRSSSHNLPDLVAALHNGQINIDLDGRIDSVKNGRIRNTFEAVPDAPVTSFTLEMQGGKKGLLVNSTDLCKKTNKALAAFTGQNGKVSDTNPVVSAQCPKGRKGKKAKGKAKRLALRARW